MSSQCGELRPLAAEIDPVVCGTPANFNGFRVLAALLHGTPAVGRQPNFAAFNRGRHLYSSGRPSRWALAHIYSCLCFTVVSKFQRIVEYARYYTSRKITAKCVFDGLTLFSFFNVFIL